MSAKIIFASVINDNMVLQQNATVTIWGWANRAQELKVVGSWNTSDTVKIKSDFNAKWTANLKTTNAGGPYNIKVISGGDVAEVKNVLLGEVWLCSGQSNMEMDPGWGVFVNADEMTKADNPSIRIFQLPLISAEYPQQNCHANWKVCTPTVMRGTSSVAYFFAQEIHKKLIVPVGIIVSAWGGTPAEVWMEKWRVEQNPTFNDNKPTQQYDWWPIQPGVAYNSMIAPLIPYNIAGAIWYQGEANTETPKNYALLMKELIENWRKDFKKDFPFYFVQIAPYNYSDQVNVAFLREQQEKTADIVPNTGMVVVSDLVDNINDIHPKNKFDVAKRLSAFALAETYHQNITDYKSPTYASMKVEKNKIRVSFKNVSGGLKSTGKSPIHFMIAGDDRVFVRATAKIEGDKVVVSSKQIKNPVAVRYSFDNNTMADVFNVKGNLPVAPFRTDNWDK